jgi:glycine oxidase
LVTTHDTADTLIVGGGLIGLACAAALARDGATSIVVDETRPGAASRAAAGMLAPGVDRPDRPEHIFSTSARARYPAYLEWLRDATGIAVPLNARGILQVAMSPAGVRGLQRAMPPTATWLDDTALRAIEPELSHALGAVHHPLDGAVDNVILLEALRVYCAASARVRTVHASALSIALRVDGASVRVADGSVLSGGHLILAAGAWASGLAGLPRSIPVTPARGQMLAYPGARVRHVLFGPRGYVIPREIGPLPSFRSSGETLVGATTEDVGFDDATTSEGAAKLRAAGSEILPALRDAIPHRHWSGLRPMTPDLLPIIGRDPREPSLLYACGHSRNGILMAPLTADCLSALVRGAPLPADLAPFAIDRFAPS